MVQFRNVEKEIIFKIVYYGPALGGKTTNLETLHKITDPEGKTQITSLKTQEDRTLFFDLLPFDLGEIQGYKIRIQIYTVPGQVHYNTTRRIVLAGADAIVFVADSQVEKLQENRTSWENMKANLVANKMDINSIPIVIQFNKIDLKNIATPEEIIKEIKPDKEYDVIQASALTGKGVVKTFKLAVIKSVIEFARKFKLHQKGVTPEKLEKSINSFFEEFEKVELQETTSEEPKLEAKVPLSGLTEEEQLIAALKSTTEIAEKYGEIERINNILKERLKEFSFLYELGLEIDKLKEEDEILKFALEKLYNLKRSFSYSLFKFHNKKLSLMKLFGMEKDFLLTYGNTPSSNLLLSIISKKEDLRTDDLREKIVELLHKDIQVPQTVLTLCLNPKPEVYFYIFIYSNKSESLDSSLEQFFKIFKEFISSKIENIYLLNELKQLNDELEKRVIKRTAELSNALESLKELDNIKRAFLNTISHEIKTPLTVIKSHSEFLLRHPEKWFEKGNDFLGEIKSNTEKLETIISNLLDFSYIKEPKVNEKINLTEILEKTIAELSPLAKKKRVEIELKIEGENIDYPISMEEARILFKNITHNAIKYSPENQKIKVFLMKDEKRIIFSVRDFGKGFDKNNPYLKLEPSIDKNKFVQTFKEEGFGLGLFFVKEILKKYGGSLHIEDMNPGTTVLIELFI